MIVELLIGIFLIGLLISIILIIEAIIKFRQLKRMEGRIERKALAHEGLYDARDLELIRE
jgi:hypothetical protein